MPVKTPEKLAESLTNIEHPRRVKILSVLALMALLIPLPSLLAHTSDNAPILGRYAPDYFLFLLAFAGLIAVWAFFTAWMLTGRPRRLALVMAAFRRIRLAAPLVMGAMLVYHAVVFLSSARTTGSLFWAPALAAATLIIWVERDARRGASLLAVLALALAYPFVAGFGGIEDTPREDYLLWLPYGALLIGGAAGLVRKQASRQPVPRWYWYGIVSALALIIVAAQYRLVLTDVGLLTVGDDRDMIRHAADGFTLDDLLMTHGSFARTDSLMPTTRLVFNLIYALAGDRWLPYGWLLLLGHVAASSLLGCVVLRYTRSPGVALALTIPYVLSVSQSHGLLANAEFSQAYISLAAFAALVFLAEQMAHAPGWRWFAVLLVGGLLTLGINTQNIMIFPLALLYYATFRAANSGSLRDVFRFRRADWMLLGGLAILALLYGAMWAIGVRLYNNPLPGTTEFCFDPNAAPLFIRFTSLFQFSFSGNRFADSVRPEVFWTLLLPAGVGFLGWQTTQGFRTGDNRRKTLGLLALANLIAAAGSTLMVTMGRTCLDITITRYNMWPTLFSMLALGFAAALLLDLLRNQQGLFVIGIGVLLLYSYHAARLNRAAVAEDLLAYRAPYPLSAEDEEVLSLLIEKEYHEGIDWLAPPEITNAVTARLFNRYTVPIWWNRHVPCAMADSEQFYGADAWDAAIFERLEETCRPALILVPAGDSRAADLGASFERIEGTDAYDLYFTP